MSTVFLKRFLDNVGRSIHSLNTVCVGLNGVSSGFATKPEDMDVTWKPGDVATSSAQARIFVIKSTYVFLSTNFEAYLKNICSLFVSNVKDYSSKSLVEKVEYIYKKAGLNEKNYRLILLKMIIHMRNRIVHLSSKSKLSSSEKDKLLEEKDYIYSNHCHFDIQQMLENFSNSKYTLKDVSTMAANAIYVARIIDEKVCLLLDTKEKIENFINSSDLKDEWKKIKKHGRRGRKIEYFLKINFPFFVNSAEFV